ncbi:hypothetical protein LNV08_15550 [Paucibacter sp. TC2R-5]|uniref:hypothetical protein n=1 Tax=Paucibacter sp. TC2R-5 TaxID=2893555 RepID=UPI0021E3EB99|nr:hypothetical protein [Paucibacter sp. TC2R-5]MCV2360391.1 hypothetical protein [Paucibacter sp. TC2R-5]
MLTTRKVVWPVIAASYGALLAALVHWATGTWSGIASLGMLFAVFVGTPSLVAYVGYLWRKNMLRGKAKLEVALCVAFPLLLFALWAAVVLGAKR